MQFIQSIVDVEHAEEYFIKNDEFRSRYMEDFLHHLLQVPDVIRTNIYSVDRRILWSSDPALIGRSFGRDANPELNAALSGRPDIHEEKEEGGAESKPEHVNLGPEADYFIEMYVPIRNISGERVIGVMELYRAPRLLHDTIRDAERFVWIGALSAGVLFYLAVLPLMRRADNLIRTQQDRLVEAETLAAIGEMGSAVAHGIRNPLAAIRSSAEIMREGIGKSAHEVAGEIISEVDRLEGWVRELLVYARPAEGKGEPVSVQAVVAESLRHFSIDLDRRSIATRVDVAANLPTVLGDPFLLGQVIHSLVSNAIEAMEDKGTLNINASVTPDGAQVLIGVEDDGAGMTPEQLETAFKPFYTTKSRGLGVGLPLARRIVLRLHGHISLISLPGGGTRAEIVLPVA